MAIAMTFFELLVIFLQAYVFTVLIGTYLRRSAGTDGPDPTEPHHPRTTPPAARHPAG